MFTGVIKLAQIDDYIAPSQNCVQPKILKKDNKQQKATVTLNDCLACSGCITSAQSILIQQMSVNKFIQISKQLLPTYVIISPQALLSLGRYYKLTVGETLKRIKEFMKKYYSNVVAVYQQTQAIRICQQLIFNQFITKFKASKLPVLCSECPGWVCYAEKTLNQTVTNFMSEVKSPQQIMAQIIKNKQGKQCKVISIMPCYDKKLEAIRFQIQQNIKQVDLTLATIQIVDLIKKNQAQGIFQPQSDHFNQTMQQQINQNISFVKDPTSNGYLQYILNRLQIAEFKCDQVKNSDFKEYSFKWQQKQYKMAKCYGFRNIQKVVQLIKKNKCPYLYVQIMACPGGCFGGGGQIRYQNVKNKQIVSQFSEQVKKYPTLSQSQNLDVNLFNLKKQNLYVKYKPIQKTMTEAVMNW